MSKRLKAPKYVKMVAFYEGLMVDPKTSARVRLTAANKLHELFLKFEAEDSKAASHRRRLELIKLQIANPSVPMPTSDPETDEKPVDVGNAFDFLKKPTGGKDAASV